MTEAFCIIGVPDKGQDASGYAKGTRSITCEDCGGATYFAPSSLNRPEAKDARFICIDCAKKMHASATKPIETGPLTDEQRREFTDRGLDPDTIQLILDEFGVEGILALADPERLIDMTLAKQSSRPNDAQLADIAKNLRTGIVAAGLQVKGPSMSAIAMLSLVTELIELRAKVRT